MEIISSNKNERIKNISALQKSKKARTEQGVFVAEGLRIARDVFKSALDLTESVFLSETFWNNKGWNEYPELAVLGFDAKDQPFSLTVVKDNVFEGMCETVTPQGILCVVRQPDYAYEKDMQGRDGIQKLLILEDIQDPGNLGTMVRTAEAAGMNGIILSKGCADIFSPKVTRSTMGAIFRVPFIYTDDLPLMLDRLKTEGIDICAAYLKDGEDYRKMHFEARTAIMIGNEGNGLSDRAVAHASRNVFIPMAGEVESLNAAVAAALLMYAL